MDRTVEQWNFREGDEVYGGDGGKVGKVVAVRPRYIVVEKGFFFPTDYYVPTSAIATYDGNKVYLTVTKDEALNQGWDQEPVEDVVLSDPATMGATGTATREPEMNNPGAMPGRSPNMPSEQRTMDDTNPL
jgi:hypothetical protein